LPCVYFILVPPSKDRRPTFVLDMDVSKCILVRDTSVSIIYIKLGQLFFRQREYIKAIWPFFLCFIIFCNNGKQNHMLHVYFVLPLSKNKCLSFFLDANVSRRILAVLKKTLTFRMKNTPRQLLAKRSNQNVHACCLPQ
jgi:hypothetical protein